MINQFIENHKKALLISIASLVLLIVGISVIFALSPKDEPINTAQVTSDTPSSEPTSSVEIVVPEIKKPVKPQSSEPVSSEPVSSEPMVNITSSVDTKPALEPPKTSSEAVTSKPSTPPEGDLMPQANPDYAKPANRNMPSFTVDNNVMGPQGYHGQQSGSEYYHAGCDTWMDERYWFVYRYGQHPEATSYNPRAPQVSPYQQDGDYDPFNPGREPGSGCYHCAACKSWVDSTAWENGKHGSGRNHIANTKKLG